MGVTSVAIQYSIIDLLSKGVDKIRDRMASLARGNKEVQLSFDRMSRSAKYAAVSGIATREMYKGLKPAVAAAGSLQAEMLGTRAELAGQVKEAKELEGQLKKVKSTAFEVQAWTPFDQSQVVALEKELLKAGAKVEQVIGEQGAAAASSALGTYEGIDPAAMGKKLIGIATPFKLQAGDFMNLADEISRASSASTVGAEEIAETAKYAAPAMAQLGRSTHEMLVLSAVLAQRGIEASMAGTGLRQFFNAAAKYKVFRDAAGNLLPLEKIIGTLRTRLKSLGEAEKLNVLTQMFDMRGAPVALALMDDGEASFRQIEDAMKDSLPLSEKLRIKMEGFNAQWMSLKGTGRSTLASLYEPALAPLTYLVKKTNEFMYALGRASQKSETLGKAVSGISLGGLVTGGLVTAGLGAAALYYGRRVLKGVGGIKGIFSGLGGTAAGIATGKLVEKTTGVTPVFVTNWPAGGGPITATGTGIGAAAGTATAGAAGTAAETAAGAAGGSLLRKLGAAAKASGKYLAMFAMSPVSQLSMAGAAGYGAGTLVNKYLIDGTAVGDKIGEVLNRIAAAFGSEESKRAIENHNAISIELNVDESRRIVATTNDMNTKIDLKRGRF
jgi:TP901 family phage tail tape measure protein